MELELEGDREVGRGIRWFSSVQEDKGECQMVIRIRRLIYIRLMVVHQHQATEGATLHPTSLRRHPQLGVRLGRKSARGRIGYRPASLVRKEGYWVG